MADKKENSRADELFDILNEFRDDIDAEPKEPKKPESQSGIDISDRVDEMLDILSKGNEPEEEPDEVPLSIFSHLSEEGDGAEPAAMPQTDSNPHFSDHFASLDESAEIPPLPDENEPEAVEEAEEDGEERESIPRRIWNGFKSMSFVPKAIVYIALVLIVSAYLSYYIITIGNDVFALVTESREITVTIEEGATDESVAEMLKSEGIIEYGWVYKIYMKYRGDGDSSTEYVVGEHKINTNYNYSQIISALTRRGLKYDDVRITIPEGFTVDQIIDLLVEKGLGQKEDYVKAINEYPYKHEFVRLLEETGYSENRKYRLEGYLYPDTYDVYTEEFEANLNYDGDYDYEVYVINIFLNGFNKKFWKDFTRVDKEGDSYQKNVLDKYGLTFDDLIVLASMIQSEGGNAEDFEYISYVFHNRLSHPKTYPKLESDATIQYVLPERISDSTELDISYESPYNTYLYDGLPPGAISCPGADALAAAMFPSPPLNSNGKEIKAYFFVSNNAGKTYYASGRSGHEKNVAQVKKDNAAIEAGTYE
ncbi:MAG: endolytic transglycosylase MltG [Clostridia bacterium]|nr:endolytic transglycosylase MltG [Clostridia bacterium]